MWDSVYYVRIAQCGYEYEQTYAFFPLLPLCISLLSRTGSGSIKFSLVSRFGNLSCCSSVEVVVDFDGFVSVLAPLIPVIGHRAVLGLSGYLINNVAFVFAALYLYR